MSSLQTMAGTRESHADLGLAGFERIFCEPRLPTSTALLLRNPPSRAAGRDGGGSPPGRDSDLHVRDQTEECIFSGRSRLRERQTWLPEQSDLLLERLRRSPLG